MTIRTNSPAPLSRTILGERLLMQVSYCRRVPGFGKTPAIKSSFTSVVTVPGKIGLFVDKPYYCYSGDLPHRYRRIPFRTTCGLLAMAARAEAIGGASRLRGIISRLARSAIHLATAPSRTLADRKARRELAQFFEGLK